MNNLRVDLLFDEERRSASPISPKVALRTGATAVALGFLAFGAYLVVSLKFQDGEFRDLERTWNDTQPRLEKIRRSQQELNKNKAILEEIHGWNKSRMSWRDHLDAFQRIVPAEIQITKLQISDRLLVLADGEPALFLTMWLEGKAKGNSPEATLKAFEKKLSAADGLRGLVEKVEVKAFETDHDPATEKHHRIFRMEVTYRPRKLTHEVPR